MSKINYSKVEEALLSAQENKQREQLLQESMAAEKQEEARRVLEAQEAERMRIAHFKLLQQRLRWFFKQDPEFHIALGVSKETIVRCLESKPDQLSPEDWKAVETLSALCAEKKESIEAKGGLTTDEKWIKKARRKQKKKPFHFHTNDKWLAT